MLDTSGILFFLGILMSIGVLDKAGLLKTLAVFLNDNLPSQEIIATVIGIASALIDNVPLVAATMGMYDLNEFGTDDRLWQLIALCAGTGGGLFSLSGAPPGWRSWDWRRWTLSGTRRTSQSGLPWGISGESRPTWRRHSW